MTNICFLAQFPPPVHGLSKAVETLYNSRLQGKYGFEKIDIANNKAIIKSLWKLMTTKAPVVYFTIAQTKGGNWRDLLFLKIIELRKKRCIVHLHGGYYRTLIDNDCSPFQRKLNFNAMKGVDAAIVLGDSLKWIFKDIIDASRIHVVKNCIDDQFCAVNIEVKLESLQNDEKLHVLYLSNFIASKGYPELLQVAKVLHDKGMDNRFEFHFAGKFFEKKEEDFFRGYVKDNALEQIVTLHGPTYREAKSELLKKCHVFSLLTTYPNEGQPISILEAMGNGMAIITTDHAGIADVATMENGYVCKKTDIDTTAVADYLERIYADREALAKVCEKNYKRVGSEFTERNYIDAMERVFDAVTSK